MPAYYREFLRVLGKNGGGFMTGTHIFPRDVDEFPRWRRIAIRLMHEGGLPAGSLPANALVFGDHQGYQVWYLIVDPSADDPPVYYYHEGKKESRRVGSRFTEFIVKLVEENLREKLWLEEQLAKRDAARAALDATRGSNPP